MLQPDLLTLIPTAAPDSEGTDTGTKLETELEARTKTIAQIRKMARVLPEPGFLLACLVMLQQSGWLNAAQLHYFQGAVIFGKTDWNTIPPEMTQKLMQAVRLERFWLLLDEAEQVRETQACTPAEMVCAIQPYTLVAPLLPRYSEAVLWAFGEMVNQHPDLFGQATASWNDVTPAGTVRPPRSRHRGGNWSQSSTFCDQVSQVSPTQI